MAVEAGVSVATVSRVLSGRGPVKPATARLVRDAAGRLGYRPSASAASLRTARSMLVGVLVPSLANPTYLPLLRAVESATQAEGYAVVVVDTQGSPQRARRQVELLDGQRVDGLVVLHEPGRSPHLDAALTPLRRAGTTVVDPWHSLPDTDPDELAEPGVGLALEHLARLGHRRIGTVARGYRRPPGARRRRLDQTARARGLEIRDITLPGPDPAPDAVGEVLTRAVNRDGLTVLWSNAMALTPLVLEGMASAGLRIPEDCSFLSFGDSPWVGAYQPGIATVAPDLAGIGAALAHALLAGLGRRPVGATPTVAPDRFEARSSLGPPGVRPVRPVRLVSPD